MDVKRNEFLEHLPSRAYLLAKSRGQPSIAPVPPANQETDETFTVEGPEAYEFADKRMHILASRVTTWWWEEKPRGTRDRLDDYAAIVFDGSEVFRGSGTINTWGTTGRTEVDRPGAWEHYFERLWEQYTMNLPGTHLRLLSERRNEIESRSYRGWGCLVALPVWFFSTGPLIVATASKQGDVHPAWAIGLVIVYPLILWALCVIAIQHSKLNRIDTQINPERSRLEAEERRQRIQEENKQRILALTDKALNRVRSLRVSISSLFAELGVS